MADFWTSYTIAASATIKTDVGYATITVVGHYFRPSIQEEMDEELDFFC
jgi:hypothetical protein